MPPRDAGEIAAARYMQLAAREQHMASKVTLLLKQLPARGLRDAWIGAVAIPVINEIVAAQAAEVATATGYVAASLAAQGSTRPAVGLIDISGFVGTTADGRAILDPLTSVVGSTIGELAAGAPQPEALLRMQTRIVMVAQTEARQAALNAETTAAVVRGSPGYVRYLRPPSCSRCVILAGRVYRHSHGFQRHPRCDCGMRPTPAGSEFDTDKLAKVAGRGELVDPVQYFHALSTADQDATFGKAGADAIRAGANPAAIVNIDRKSSGLYGGGAFTREGTTPRGGGGAAMWRDYLNSHPQSFANDAEQQRAMSRYLAGQQRLTPTEIIRRAGDDMAERLRLLKANGYLQP